MHDVLVLGGGLAGSLAALAARQTGATVALASRSWGATALSTGALDIAYTPAFAPQARLPRSLTDHVQDIIAHRPRHPYGVLGLEQTQSALQAGFALLRTALEDSGLDLQPLHLDQENLGLASSLGAVVPAASAMAPHAGVPMRDGNGSSTWGVLRFAGDAYFDATRICRGVRHDAEAFYGQGVQWQEIPLTFASQPPMAMARNLDDRAVVQTLAKELQGKVRGLEGILAPPVLGLERYKQTRQALSDATGLPVVEALGHMPSVPGVRLQRALERALQAAGVQTVGAAAAPQLDTKQRLIGVLTRDNLDISAHACVLATGRFIAGGLTWGDEGCQEALFGLPVVTELGWMEQVSPHAVVRETPVQSHPLMTAGIKVNRQLQPIREGQVAFDNLFAAGMVIGGFASRYALCADGVALASGWLAGQAAGRRS